MRDTSFRIRGLACKLPPRRGGLLRGRRFRRRLLGRLEDVSPVSVVGMHGGDERFERAGQVGQQLVERGTDKFEEANLRREATSIFLAVVRQWSICHRRMRTEGCAGFLQTRQRACDVPVTLQWKNPSHDRKEERSARHATFRDPQGPKTPALCVRSNLGVLAAASCSVQDHQI